MDERTLDLISDCWARFRKTQSVMELNDTCRHAVCVFLLKIAAVDPESTNDPEIAGDIKACSKYANPDLLARIVASKVDAICGDDLDCYDKYSPSEIMAIKDLAAVAKDDVAKLLSQFSYTEEQWSRFMRVYQAIHSRKVRFIKERLKVKAKAEDELLKEKGLSVEKIRLR